MKYSKVLLITLALAALPRAAEAKKLSAAQFLASANKDYKLRNNRELTRYFKNAETSTPYLDRIELRPGLEVNTEDSTFDFLRHSYQLRFYPKGWGETGYTRQLTETVNRSNRLSGEALFNAALQRRYALLLDLLEVKALLDLQRQLLAVYKDRITVLRKMSATVPNFDVTTVIRAENNYINQRLAIIRLQDRLTSTKHKIALAAGGAAEVAVSSADLLPIAAIAKLARTVKPKGPVDNVYLQRRRMRIKLADVKYKLEVAKGRDWLSFFKLSFDTASRDRGSSTYNDHAFSVGMALKMPFINPDRYEANRRKVSYLEEKLRLEDERRATSERIVSHSRSLARLLAQHKVLRDRKDRGDAEASFKRYLAMDGVDPVILLKVKESILKGDIHLTEIENAIRKRHVALLDVLGRLGARPLRNVISKQGEALR